MFSYSLCSNPGDSQVLVKMEAVVRCLNHWEKGSCRWPRNCGLQFSHSVMSNSLQAHGLQHARLSSSSQTPGACSNSCPSSRWCHPTISSSVVPYSFRLQSFPVPGSFPVNQFFTSGSQSIGASSSVLPINIQDWFLLGWTSLISLMSKGPSRIFSNNTVQKHWFFGAQLSL